LSQNVQKLHHKVEEGSSHTSFPTCDGMIQYLAIMEAIVEMKINKLLCSREEKGERKMDMC
jgi:hypothetical protein